MAGWERFIGAWELHGAHPLLPGEPIRGRSTFDWLDGRAFVIWRSHYEHPEIPDAIAVVGADDDVPLIHYFDARGVRRIYTAHLDGDSWRYWRDATPPDLSQRFTGTFGDDGATIAVRGELSRDGSTWEPDLALDYRRER